MLSKIGNPNTIRILSLNSSSVYIGYNKLFKNSSRSYYYKGIYLHPGPGHMDLEDGATKPDGVPDTWTTADIGWPQCDFGRFDEDTFPPAIEGETLEQYCRRVPNVWSPCSKSTDVVDVQVFQDLLWANDWGPPRMGMLEEAMIKLPPESADWHVTYVPDYDAMLKEMCFRNRPFQIKVTEEEYSKMLEEFERGIKEKGIDYHFKSRVFHDFWLELTGKSVKEIADIPTWEEEIERRIEIAKERNKKYWLSVGKQDLEQQQSLEPEPEKVKVES